MNPNPANIPTSPSPDFSAYQWQARFVGPLGDCREAADSSTTFKCATLQCTPHYIDWHAALGGQVLHVTGAEIVPSSTYDVQVLAAVCQGNEASCPVVSDALRITTARWGDIVEPFQDPSPAPLTQPNISDVAAVVDKFKGVASAPIKAGCQLQPNLPDRHAAINILDVANTVDAFKGIAYPYSGPVSCP
jgi:hypothetical protein